MASKFYSLDRGETANPDNVTVGNASSLEGIELRVDLVPGFTTLDIAERVDAILRRILDGRDSVIGQV